MSLTPAELQARAKKQYAKIKRRRRDPRYEKVLGRLCEAGYLTTNVPIAPHDDAIRIADALWVGELEPRVLELLPALIVKAPSLFEDIQDLPDDLASVVRALRRHETPADFRGIPGRDMQRWLPRVGRKDKLPSRLKAFRFQATDARLLAQLSAALDVTETEVIRRGLRLLAGSELLVETRAEKSAKGTLRASATRGRRRA